jgi:biopolymer transport protein ExbD
MDTTMSVRNAAIDKVWLEKRREKKEKRRSREFPQPKIMITSLMDAFTIILCFLLAQFGGDPIRVTESDQLRLPRTTSQAPLVDAVAIAISTHAIMVQDKKVLDLRNGKVDESMKRDGEEGLMINPLFDALKEEANHIKMIAARNSQIKFDGLALIIADKRTSYRLLSEVLYTAGQAEFDNFKFIATEGPKS